MGRPASADKTNREDGRVQRGEKNRERILDALFELIRGGELVPTAEQVAEHAGVGTRTVFRHFADMESLFRELQERILRELRPELGRKSGGSVATRASQLVRDRAALFERIAPFKRSAAIHRWHSSFIERDEAQTVHLLRSNLLEVLPELAESGDARLEAVDLLTGFEAWDRLRREQKLGRERATEVLELALTELLRELS